MDSKGSLQQQKNGQTWEKFQTGGGLPVGREFQTFLTGKTDMNGKYPKHSETSRKAIKKNSFGNFDLSKVPKFPKGGGVSEVWNFSSV